MTPSIFSHMEPVADDSAGAILAAIQRAAVAISRASGVALTVNRLDSGEVMLVIEPAPAMTAEQLVDRTLAAASDPAPPPAITPEQRAFLTDIASSLMSFSGSGAFSGGDRVLLRTLLNVAVFHGIVA